MSLPPLDTWRARVSAFKKERGISRFSVGSGSPEADLRTLLKEITGLVKAWNDFEFPEWLEWEKTYRDCVDADVKHAMFLALIPNGQKILDEYGPSATKRHMMGAVEMLRDESHKDQARALQQLILQRLFRVLDEFPPPAFIRKHFSRSNGEGPPEPISPDEQAALKKAKGSVSFYGLVWFAANTIANAVYLRDLENPSALPALDFPALMDIQNISHSRFIKLRLILQGNKQGAIALPHPA